MYRVYQSMQNLFFRIWLSPQPLLKFRLCMCLKGDCVNAVDDVKLWTVYMPRKSQFRTLYLLQKTSNSGLFIL